MHEDTRWRLLESASILRRLQGNPDMADPEYRRCWIGTVLGNLDAVLATEFPKTLNPSPNPVA
jgi:hypothetical protein